MKTYGSLEEFVLKFEGIFSNIQTELCVARFGYDLYTTHVNSVNKWRESMELFLEEIRRLESHKELFGDDEEEIQLTSLRRMVGQYEHQLSDSYTEKLYDKLSRFAGKVEGLEIIGGASHLC